MLPKCAILWLVIAITIWVTLCFDLGILYQLLGRSRIALMMFDNSAKLREMQYSESSFEVADVYHNIALIYQRLGNYKDAIANF